MPSHFQRVGRSAAIALILIPVTASTICDPAELRSKPRDIALRMGVTTRARRMKNDESEHHPCERRVVVEHQREVDDHHDAIEDDLTARPVRSLRSSRSRKAFQDVAHLALLEVAQRRLRTWL